MNNKIKTTALVASLLGLPVLVNAADGTVNFAGTIVAQGCSINTLNQTVNMGNISASTLNGSAGLTTSGQAFTIEGNNCPNSLSAIVFSGMQTPDNSSGLFALSDTTSAGGAGNVAIGIYMDDDITLVENGESTALPQISNNNLNQTFYAKYVSTADTVSPGTANASVTFTLEY